MLWLSSDMQEGGIISSLFAEALRHRKLLEDIKTINIQN